MRLIVLFDIPIETKAQQKQYRYLIKVLEKEGFLRYQYSVYIRTCVNYTDVNNCLGRLYPLINKIPGQINALTITDKQFAKITPLNLHNHTNPQITNGNKKVITI